MNKRPWFQVASEKCPSFSIEAPHVEAPHVSETIVLYRADRSLYIKGTESFEIHTTGKSIKGVFRHPNQGHSGSVPSTTGEPYAPDAGGREVGSFDLAAQIQEFETAFLTARLKTIVASAETALEVEVCGLVGTQWRHRKDDGRFAK